MAEKGIENKMSSTGVWWAAELTRPNYDSVSEVQKQLSVEGQEVAALLRTQTVGEIDEAVLNEIKSVGGCAPVAAFTAPASYSARI